MKEEGSVALTRREDGTEFGGLRVVWLEAFVRCAQARTRAAVAAQMGIDQATVTKHIQKLELWLARGRFRPLFHDNVWPVHLTEEGKEFLPQALMVLELLRRARIAPVETPQADATVEHVELPNPAIVLGED